MDGGRASMARPAVAGGATSPAPPQFPAGLRVLVVDDDPTCLKIVEKMLRNCLYDVTTCSRAVVALSMLRERKGGFDLVLSDVYMPDMDGFKLLEHIGLEMDLPVIMMSADDGKDVVMKGVTHGACDYLIKPVRMEALKTIWQHVVRKKRNELKEMENSGSLEEGDKHKRVLDDVDNASSVNDGNWKNVKRRKEGKEEEDEIEEREDSSTLKKPRVVWSVELHQQFVAAVNQLGVDKAVPKKILELMNVPGLTRENVASHLQKYRLYLRRVSVSQHQGRFDTTFSGPTEAFGSSTSLEGFDLQVLAVSGQLPPQSLMTMHAGARRVANTASGITAVDQIGFFNSDAQIANSSRVRPASGQLLNNKQMNLICGPSASRESIPLGQSPRAVQLYGNMGLQVSEGTPGFLNLPSSLRTSSSFPGGPVDENLSNSFAMQMTQRGQQFSLSQQQNHVQNVQHQTQLKGQLLNGHVLSSTIGQQILSNEISGHVRSGTTINGNTSLTENYTNSSSYGAVPRAQFSEFQNSCMTESAGSCYPLVSSMGSSSLTSSGIFQEAVPATGNLQALSNTTSLKGVKDFIPSYDLYSDLNHSKNQDWKLQSINLSYDPTQHLGSKQNTIDFGSSNSAHEDFNATLKDGHSRNISTLRKDIISVRTESERKVGRVAQLNSPYLIENSVRVKTEIMPDASGQDALFCDNIISNELMSVIARQPQEGVRQGDAEFYFDGYPLDDIPV